MTDSAILRFNRDLLFELETDGTPEGSIVTAPFSGTIPGGPVLSFNSKVETTIPLIVDINPVQEGSGSPSPSNVRPINGWNSINIYVSPNTSSEDGRTITINLPQTVYGGVLDVVSGKLAINRAVKDLGTINWQPASSPVRHVFRFYASDLNPQIAYPDIDTPTTAICEQFGAMAFGPISTSDNYKFAVGTASNNILTFIAQDYSTVEAFTTAMNGVKLVYPLATPIEITLTPTEVKTLIGPNNIWSNSGDVYTTVTTENVTYKIIGGAEDVQRFNKIWDSLLLYRNGGITDEHRNISGEGDKIIPHGPSVLKEE